MITPISIQNSMLNNLQAMKLESATNVTSEIAANPLQSTFSTDFQQVIHNINQDQNIASEMMHAVDTGRSDDVIGAMVASQKASLSFSMLLEVRQKVMNGVDDIMRMSL